jgi:hypothetical protein
MRAGNSAPGDTGRDKQSRRFRREFDRAIRPEAHNIKSRTEPHASIPRLKKELTDRLPVASAIGLELTFCKTSDASGGVDPELPSGILANRIDEYGRQPVALRVRCGNTIVQPNESAALRADPQISGAVLVQSGDPVCD